MYDDYISWSKQSGSQPFPLEKIVIFGTINIAAKKDENEFGYDH
jgi:hypothetical protein